MCEFKNYNKNTEDSIYFAIFGISFCLTIPDLRLF